MSTPAEALDRLEADLASAEAALARGEAPLLRRWEAPVLSAAPAPGDLRRAAELGQRFAALKQALVAAQSAVAEDLAALEGQRRAARAYGQSGPQEAPAAADN